MDMNCEVEDDEGKKCSNVMSKKEKRRDGMCTRCAEMLWDNYARPTMLNEPQKPIVFKDHYRGYAAHS